MVISYFVNKMIIKVYHLRKIENIDKIFLSTDQNNDVKSMTEKKIKLIY